MLGTLVVALLAAGSGERQRWAEQALPLRPGTIELRLGAGPTFVTDASGTPRFVVAHALAVTDLSWRVGLSERFQLTGLSLSFTALDGDAGTPGLILTGGLLGLGFSSLEGFIAVPGVSVATFVERDRWVGALDATVSARVSGAGRSAGLSAVVELSALRRVSDGFSLGASVGGAWAWVDSRLGRSQAVVPGLARARGRFHLSGVWAVDLEVAASPGWIASGVSLVWAPSALWGSSAPARWW